MIKMKNNNINISKAIILAAGKGKRMNNPFASKPMTFVRDKRLIQYGIDVLMENEIKDIYIIYSEFSKDVVNLRKNYPNINFIKQDVVDGSLSSYIYISEITTEPFLLLDCDIIFFNNDFKNMMSYVKECEETAYFAVVSKPNFNSPKYIKINNNLITEFNKKGIENGLCGGMIYVWIKFPIKLAKEFYKRSNSLGEFYSYLVKKEKIRPMYIDKLWDVDTQEDVIIAQEELGKLFFDL